MSIIGNNTVGGNYTFDANKIYAHNLSAYHYSPDQDELVTKLYIRTGAGPNNVGNTAELGIYDISAGVNGATLVGAKSTITGTADIAEWLEADLTGSEINLQAGKTYAIFCWTDEWKGAVSGDWVLNANLRQDGEAALVSTFNSNTSSWSNGTLAIYADTVPLIENTSPKITNVNNGGTVADGETPVRITGVFADSGNSVIVSPEQDINDVGALTQTIISESSAIIDITVSLPDGSSFEGDPVHFYANNGAENSLGYAVQVTQLIQYDHTIIFEDEVDLPILVLSPSGDFARGFSAFKNDVEALFITADDTPPSSIQIIKIQWADGLKVISGDAVRIIYSKNIGDLQSDRGELVESFVLEQGNVVICP